MPPASPATDTLAPGSVVVVRDEEWLVTSATHTPDGWLIEAQGLSELVRETTATFYDSLDTIEPLDPSRATVIADDSPHYRRSRLWLEATLRKTPIPLSTDGLSVATEMLADSLGYQLTAVRRALDPDKLRPRILLADAVGLGKTLEIGMILSELVRRGRGERILIISPRHVLEQMQHEMWSRFALPFVRLDSLGIQRVRQRLPATRNPFAYYKRIIVSIDTLKSDRYAAHLRQQRWDAVVIDESHNVTNSGTQNHRLATIVAPNTDALILASATPHNGKAESFAELVRLLEPTAVAADGTVNEDELRRIVVRRHRGSPEVASQVGAEWATRKEPKNLLIEASDDENAVAEELATTWLHPATGRSPYSGRASHLFPWTLAKAFLSSPAALAETISERLRRLDHTSTGSSSDDERQALTRLANLNDQVTSANSAKYQRLVSYLKEIGIGPRKATRAVVFAERIATLHWLKKHLTKDLGLPADAVAILHGGLSDIEQQEIIESFKQATSPIRVLVTGDVASEGVNLHLQCHDLIHYDIPWSLIRIEQRNGRIDRYGQRHHPQITTLLLEPSSELFSGDLRVLSRLIDKEHQAHQALGDAASLMGKYDVEAEEDEIRRVLAGQEELDEVVKDPQAVAEGTGITALFARLTQDRPEAEEARPPVATQPRTAYLDEASFLLDALDEAYSAPGLPLAAGGIELRTYPDQSLIELDPPTDLVARLEVLPQTYLRDRKVTSKLRLVTTPARGKAILAEALSDPVGSSWPEAHYLSPLHPVLDWAADKALVSLPRNAVFAVRGSVDFPSVLLLGSLTNKRGQLIAASFAQVEFPSGPEGQPFIHKFASAAEMLREVGVRADQINPGPVPGTESLTALIAPAVAAAGRDMASFLDAAHHHAQQRVHTWAERVNAWEGGAAGHAQTPLFRARRVSVEDELRLAEAMEPDRQLLRPLLVVVPAESLTETEVR